MKICVSIASYRDLDLVNTIDSAYKNATHKDNISFCIISQDSDHPDLSQYPIDKYHKYHWKESMGVCWARNKVIDFCSSDYIFQVDSHSRFPAGWDEVIENQYGIAKEFWGEKIILTQYPYNFLLVNKKEIYQELEEKIKTFPIWDEEEKTIKLGTIWSPVQDKRYGDEVFYFAGGCSFASSKIMKSILPDPDIYFNGEEMSIALRAYTRGIRMINSPVNFIYSNFSRKNNNRSLHWEDHHDWFDLEKRSRIKLYKIYNGARLGDWGIESKPLYEQFIRLTNLYKIKGLTVEQYIF